MKVVLIETIVVRTMVWEIFFWIWFICFYSFIYFQIKCWCFYLHIILINVSSNKNVRQNPLSQSYLRNHKQSSFSSTFEKWKRPCWNSNFKQKGLVPLKALGAVRLVGSVKCFFPYKNSYRSWLIVIKSSGNKFYNQGIKKKISFKQRKKQNLTLRLSQVNLEYK